MNLNTAGNNSIEEMKKQEKAQIKKMWYNFKEKDFFFEVEYEEENHKITKSLSRRSVAKEYPASLLYFYETRLDFEEFPNFDIAQLVKV